MVNREAEEEIPKRSREKDKEAETEPITEFVTVTDGPVPVVEPTRETMKSSKQETLFEAKELLELSESIADVPKHVAAGALRHANITLTDVISREQFKSAVKDFEKVRVF